MGNPKRGSSASSTVEEEPPVRNRLTAAHRLDSRLSFRHAPSVLAVARAIGWGLVVLGVLLGIVGTFVVYSGNLEWRERYYQIASGRRDLAALHARRKAEAEGRDLSAPGESELWIPAVVGGAIAAVGGIILGISRLRDPY
jgi:hypothetical protein